MELAGKTALVTGAASGIGAAIARGLASIGCNLALVDINSEALDLLRRELRVDGLRISAHRCDIAAPEAADVLVTEVIDAHGTLSVLINNAGVALGGDFQQVDARDFDWLMQVNFAGPVRLTRAALPHLQAVPEAGIVNVSSVFGLVAPPGQTAYSASKFAIRGFTESLRHELEGTTVTVLSVHPGGIKTAIAQNAKVPDDADPAEVAEKLAQMEKSLKMAPERAAQVILRALQKQQGRVLVGSDAKALELIQRFRPKNYWRTISKLF